MRRALPYVLWLAGLGTLAVPSRRATAVQFGPNDVRSVFHIEKSENRNQVHYGIRLDALCVPVGDAPVFAYWRALQRDPRATSDLSTLERRAYGIASQRVIGRRSESGAVMISLVATPSRAIMVRSHRTRDGCVADARAQIRGTSAVLSVIYVDVGTFGVRYVELRGQRASDRRRVDERIDD